MGWESLGGGAPLNTIYFLILEQKKKFTLILLVTRSEWEDSKKTNIYKKN